MSGSQYGISVCTCTLFSRGFTTWMELSFSLFHPSPGIVRCIIDMWTIAFYWFLNIVNANTCTRFLEFTILFFSYFVGSGRRTGGTWFQFGCWSTMCYFTFALGETTTFDAECQHVSSPLSGLFARLRLIRSCVFPRELQIAQAQDLLGLMYLDFLICLQPRIPKI